MAFTRELAIIHIASEVEGYADALEATEKDRIQYMKDGRRALAALGVTEEELIEHYDSKD